MFSLLEQFTDLKIVSSSKAEAASKNENEVIDSSTKNAVKSMTLKNAFKGGNAEAEWKKLGIKNFDFIQQAFESNKYKNLSAARLAYESDFSELFFT